MACIKLWLKSGTSAKPNCETFATSQEDLTNIMPYHAGTGCDAASDIAGHGKGSAWNAFCLNPDLIANLGKGDFHDETYSSYAISSSAGYSIFLMRAAMIMHGWLYLASAEYLKHCHLPTSNALQLHIQRAHHQSMVSIQATCNIPLLPPQPETINGMVKGQRDTCSHRDTTNPNVQKLSYADAPNDASPGYICGCKNANMHRTKSCNCRSCHVYEQ